MLKYVQNATLLLTSVLLTLLVFELILRIDGVVPAPHFLRPHPILWYEPVPKAAGFRVSENKEPIWFENDAEGFRRRSDGKSRTGDLILILGDSFAEGAQVEAKETFVELTERRLRASGAAVSLVNFGVAGYAPVHEFLTYRLKGRALAPRLVVLAFCSGNDVTLEPEAVFLSEQLLRSLRGGGQVDPSLAGIRPYAPKEWLRAHTRIYPWLVEKYYLLKRVRESRNGVRSSEGEVFRRPNDPRWERAWSSTSQLLVLLNDQVRRDGGTLVIVVLPTGYQVYDDARHNHAPDENTHIVEQRLGAIGAENGIPVLRLLDDFRAVANVRMGATPLYFDRIGHFTPGGHQAVAERLAPFLSGILALPSRKHSEEDLMQRGGLRSRRAARCAIRVHA